jgi:hypothetical protein
MTFWSQPLEEYFPMAVLPGAHSTVARWRKMARTWCSSGVDRRSPRFEPFFWDQPNATFLLGPGAVWVNGFYAENSQAVVLQVPGGTGLIVARLQPEIQEVRLLWRPGATTGDELHDPEGWWDVPLFELRDADGMWWDRRRLVPIPPAPPPVTEMPAWVPRGLIGVSIGPASQWGPASGNVHVAYPFTWPRFVPGRHYRLNMWAWWTQQSAGTNIGGQVRLWTSEAAGVRDSNILFQGGGTLYDAMFGVWSMGLTNFGEQAMIVLSAEPQGSMSPPWIFNANSVRMELEDVGG